MSPILPMDYKIHESRNSIVLYTHWMNGILTIHGVKPYSLLSRQSHREDKAGEGMAVSVMKGWIPYPQEKLTITSMSSTWRWWVPLVPWSRVRASSKWAFNCRLSLYRTENCDCMQRYSGVSLTTSSTALRNSTLGSAKEKASQSQREAKYVPKSHMGKNISLMLHTLEIIIQKVMKSILPLLGKLGPT